MMGLPEFWNVTTSGTAQNGEGPPFPEPVESSLHAGGSPNAPTPGTTRFRRRRVGWGKTLANDLAMVQRASILIIFRLSTLYT